MKIVEEKSFDKNRTIFYFYRGRYALNTKNREKMRTNFRFFYLQSRENVV